MSLIRVPLRDLGEHSSASTWIYNSHGAEPCPSLALFVPHLHSSVGNWIPPMQTSGLVFPPAAHSNGERDPLNLEQTETPRGAASRGAFIWRTTVNILLGHHTAPRG